jgi:LuxR family maltose regulon positive regulatory protein
LEEAEHWLDRAEELAPAAEPATGVVVQHRTGMLRVAQGRLEEALAAFRAAQELLLTSQPFLVVQVRGALLRTQVQLGQTAAACTALMAAGEQERDGPDLREAAAAIDLAEGRPQRAVDVLAPVLAGSGPSVIGALLLAAAAHDQLGDARAAEAALERALELAEPDGIILPFTLAPIRALLERHPWHRTAHATLLSDIHDVHAGFSLPPRRGEPLDELSDAELRVLRYLPSNLKTLEIAAELFVSVHTVKTHVRHIYAKLDAHNRSEAVDRARELGLLAPASRR